MPFGCSLGGELQRILYGGRWWLPPNPNRGESSESKLPVVCPNTKGVPECELTHLWCVLDARSCNKIIVPLPSLIPKLLARPSHPPFSAGSWERPKFQLLPHFNILRPSNGSNKELRSASTHVFFGNPQYAKLNAHYSSKCGDFFITKSNQDL